MCVKRWTESAEEASSGAELVVEAILEDLQVRSFEALVDVVGLLQGFAFALCLLGHLAASKVYKVDLAMPGQLADWWFGDTYKWKW